jgi:hypothetical protein
LLPVDDSFLEPGRSIRRDRLDRHFVEDRLINPVLDRGPHVGAKRRIVPGARNDHQLLLIERRTELRVHTRLRSTAPSEKVTESQAVSFLDMIWNHVRAVHGKRTASTVLRPI